MTCSGCQAKVQSLLSKVKDVKSVTVDLPSETATIEMHHHVDTAELKAAFSAYPKYQIDEMPSIHVSADGDAPRSWWETYKTILLIFFYIALITAVVGQNMWMEHFMAGFFLIFSLFKLLDLQGFADGYSTYDIVAKQWRPWAYIYAFLELSLGVAYLTGFNPLLTNGVTFVVMSVSIVGVLQSVLNKRKIRCACLGAVFNLPMSTVTIIEDALMIGMSVYMLVKIIF